MSTETGTTVFDRVVCGVDGSDAGIVAARAAARLAAIDGKLTLLCANDTSIAVHAGWGMAHVLDELAVDAQKALERASAEAEPLHRLEAKVVAANPLRALLAEIESGAATAVVVGSHGRSRAAGIALGGVTAAVLHWAPCAVLVARGAIDPDHWPRSIVVGVDGSAESARAAEVAAALGTRFDADTRATVALEEARVDLDAVRRIAPACEEHAGRALDVFNALSHSTDLIVVGSRGLRGLRALGSLSERLAHEARCSVLVVRSAP